MWEKTFDELELETQPKSSLFDLPHLKEKTDPVLIIFIILTSSFIVVVSIKFRIFHLWAEFLGSNLFLRISTYPLLISAVIIVSGVIFRTIIWFRYKPQAIELGESVNWPLSL